MALTKNKPPAVPWTPTQLLYAFTGWLTTRKKPLVFGSNYDAAPIAELLGEFITINKLPDDLTNSERVINAVAEQPMTPDQAAGLFASKLRQMSTGDQDMTMATVIQDLRSERERRLKMSNEMKRDVDRDNDNLQNAVWNLEKIARGDVLVVRPDLNMKHG